MPTVRVLVLICALMLIWAFVRAEPGVLIHLVQHLSRMYG